MNSRKMPSWSVFVLLLFLVVGSAAQNSPKQDPPKDDKSVQPVKPTDAANVAEGVSNPPSDSPENLNRGALRIGAGDLLEMKVFGVAELTDQVRVTTGGFISLPLVGQVQIDGLTTEEAEALIAARLKDGGFVRDPHVTISVKEYVTQGISVLGEVIRPGIYPLLGARRLFDALSSAGGTTKTAGKVVTITRRDKPGDPIMVSLSTDPTLSSHSNVEIYPGDTIVVSKAGIVYVVGEVGRPSGFVMENNESLTVLQAIALAQGLAPNASLNNSKLIRKTANGRVEIPVPLKLILQSKAPDIAMQGEDILFVPTSSGKSAMRRSMEAIIQISTGVAITARR